MLRKHFVVALIALLAACDGTSSVPELSRVTTLELRIDRPVTALTAAHPAVDGAPA